MMKKILLPLYILFFVFIGKNIYAQYTEDAYKIMFYNVENLFDTENDSLKNDEEFLPSGDRYWTKSKYFNKLNNIYKVIIAVGEWNPPAIIGICEIENRKVLSDLVTKTPLVKFEYQIVHHESPDRRGIDVGLLYRDELFKPLYDQAIAVNFSDNPDYKTRDILYVKGIANNTDTLHIFVNHWPSRWGGQLESEGNRVTAAQTLKNTVDSIFNRNPYSNIIITGDFNDTPINKSLKEVLQAELNFESIKHNRLYNASYYLQQTQNIGSHKYQGEWAMLDQFIISGFLLNEKNDLYTTLDDIHVFNKDFLLEPDESFYGYKPNRTFIGYKYNGGYSDHLPIYLILNFNQ
ncbi:MAG: endonuclease [Bacteroidales bacterium]